MQRIACRERCSDRRTLRKVNTNRRIRLRRNRSTDMSDVDPKNLRGGSEQVEDLPADARSAAADAAAAMPRIAIAEALRNNWIEIWYQPKIDLKRKCLAGAEALARIRHPRFGVLLPGSFLPGVAEDSISRLAEHALIAVLGNWTMFDQAGFNLHLAINVPVSVLLKLPIPALVDKHRPKSDRWPGI